MPFFAESPADLPDRETLLSMSGLEFMRGMLDGRLPQPTIAGLLNYQLDGFGPGSARFRGTPEFRHTNPFGGVHGGWYGTVLDSVMGCAVMTTVPQGKRYTTLEFKVNITRALPVGMEIVAEAEVEHSGRSTAVAQGRIRGAEDGRVYATGSTTCIIMS